MILKGTFKNVAGRTSDGEVVLSAIVAHPSEDRDHMVTRELHRIPLEDGKFTSPQVDAGPLLMELSASGVYERWEITVPEGDKTVDVSGLLEGATDWTPPVVSRAVTAASDARKSANQAQKSAEAASESAARAEATRVTSITDDDGDGIATVAYADGREEDLPLPRGEKGERGEPGPEPDVTTQMRADAEAASQAREAAEAASESVLNVADSASWDGDQLTVLGKTSPSLTGPQGPKGDPGGAEWEFVEGRPSVATSGEGEGAVTSASQAAALGIDATAAGDAVAVGYGATSGEGSIALGADAEATGTYSLAIGTNAKAADDNAVVIGSDADSGSATAYAQIFGELRNQTVDALKAQVEELKGELQEAQKVRHEQATASDGKGVDIRRSGNVVTLYLKGLENDATFSIPKWAQSPQRPLYSHILDLTQNPSPNALLTVRDTECVVERANGKCWGSVTYIART